jgi:hypothetical protein
VPKVLFTGQTFRRQFLPGLDLRLLFAYDVAVPNARSCRVSFTDAAGITHTAQVAALSLYEAAAIGLAEFRRCGLTDATPGPATRLTVSVDLPSTVHEGPLHKLTAWLESSGKSPSEQLLKVRLREILATR